MKLLLIIIKTWRRHPRLDDPREQPARLARAAEDAEALAAARLPVGEDAVVEPWELHEPGFGCFSAQLLRKFVVSANLRDTPQYMLVTLPEEMVVSAIIHRTSAKTALPVCP